MCFMDTEVTAIFLPINITSTSGRVTDWDSPVWTKCRVHTASESEMSFSLVFSMCLLNAVILLYSFSILIYNNDVEFALPLNGT